MKFGIPRRSLSKVEADARETAKSSVPTTPRDQVASLIPPVLSAGYLATAVIAMIGLAMGSLFLGVGLPVIVFIVSILLAGLVQKLEEPREAAVRELADKKLREKLAQIDAEQFEYRRFYQTSDWQEIRDAVMERDGKACRLCGRREDLTVDHILPKSLYPERALDAENLQVLCRSWNGAKGPRVRKEEG